MAGLYFHIPFCRKKCAYCDFYSLARMSLIPDFIQSLLQEINNQPINEKIETVYFGGGTPSLLSAGQIEQILSLIIKNYQVSIDAEITLEANPDDINKSALMDWKQLGINRLSIGVQAIDDILLKTLGRQHTIKQAFNSIEIAKKIGFENISADLIYALPGLSTQAWKDSLQRIIDTGITHLSAYHLGLEPGTLMHKQVRQKKISLPDENSSIKQFEILFELTGKLNFPWYEISNFAKKGFESRHNSAYWNATPYFGFGPSAHSYDGKNRRYWNSSDIKAYLKNPFAVKTEEDLSDKDKINDHFITGIRTRKGINLAELNNLYPQFEFTHIEKYFNILIDKGNAIKENQNYVLLPSGLLISDNILKDILY
jgi:oxygen-independent coproporphyrinogen III oxidase